MRSLSWTESMHFNGACFCASLCAYLCLPRWCTFGCKLSLLCSRLNVGQLTPRICDFVRLKLVTSSRSLIKPGYVSIWFVPVVQSVLVSCSNAKKRTVCSLRSNVCARFLGLIVCILTERASVRLCVHTCVCQGGARLVVNSVYSVLG